MDGPLYSIRMRAARADAHLCGAERIAAATELPALAAALVARALAAAPGAGAAVALHVDPLEREPQRCRLPDLCTYLAADWQAGRRCARELLCRAGVTPVAADAALARLAEGAAPGGGVMRGAMIVDAASGRRLEADPARGVRVSRMDLDPQARRAVLAALSAAGLGHPRVAEAWVLAGKVQQAPGVVAELCWSDDPGYQTGYVADRRGGYQRITPIKAVGDGRGGRALFVDGTGLELARLVAFLEGEALLFNAAGVIRPPGPWEE